MAIAIGPETLEQFGVPLMHPGLGPAFERAMELSFVAFQPIVSYRERAVTGWEALVRTRASRLAAPPELIEAAESLGRLRTLGRAIRATVGNAAAVAPPGVTLFVNLHPQDLLDPDLLFPRAPLSRVAPRVVLELTERAGAAGIHDLRERLQILRGLGFRLAIDDLGAGHNNLALLAEVRPDFVKVDMSLVRGIDRDAPRRSVVRHLLSLAGELGAVAVAEGVETPAERDALLDLGGPLLLQGFLFGEPSPRPQLPRW